MGYVLQDETDLLRSGPKPADRLQLPAMTRSDALVSILLLVVLLVGGYFRFVGRNWDDFVKFHPDERFLTGVATKIDSPLLIFTGAEPLESQLTRCAARNPRTNGVGGYFDTQCSNWNPHNVGEGLYVYGTLPLFITRVLADMVVDQTGDHVWTSYDGIHLIWRAVSAVSDMIVILLVFFIGVKLHNKWTGILAAAFYAFAVFPIQQAHFGTADAAGNLFVTLAIYMAIRVQDHGTLWDFSGFGVAFGLALASRINVAPVAGLVIAAAGFRLLPIFAGGLARAERDQTVTYHMIGLALAGFVSFLTFRIFNPYAFQGPGFFGLLLNQRWLDDIATAQNLVSGNVDTPPNFQWVGRPDYLFPFNNIVVWGLGAALGITAWSGWVWSGWRILRGKQGATRNLLLFGWILVYFGWLGGNWVTTMRYFLPIYPALALLAAWALVELVSRAMQSPRPAFWRRVLAVALLAGVSGFTLLWAAMFTNIYRHMATFTQASHWVWENVPGDFAMRIDGAEDGIPLLNVAMPNSVLPFGYEPPIENRLFETATRYVDGVPVSGTFVPAQSGTVTTIHAPHLGDPNDDPDPETIRITITAAGGETPLTTAALIQNLPRSSHPLGDSYEIPLDAPLEVEAGQTYILSVTVSGGPVIGGGSVLSVESAWEEVMPAKVCQLPEGITLADDPPSGLRNVYSCNGRSPWDGLLNGFILETHWEDEAVKRERFITILNQAEYVLIPTNRRYDTQTRNPARWPMTTRFYEALFDQELGFELVATFQETFEFGPLRISDQHLPTYDSPRWLNEFEAEEAFHVYDHPVVFIFRKTDDYSPERTRALLQTFSLNRPDLAGTQYVDPTVVDVTVHSSLAVDLAPTQLMMTTPMRETQYEGGTWSNRFNSDSIINKNQILGLIWWWLVVAIIGLAAWPLLFVLLPGLADRGYGCSKFVGMLLLGWSTWYLAHARISAWSQQGLFLALLVMAAASALAAWRSRDKLSAYVRRRWGLLAWIEAMTAGAYLVFIFVRLSNPDLWVGGFGGEKPMDFAYFNGVLRSTIFPPIDPWYANGYLNYYYFGYVIVGVPTLLTGTVPSVAYNLILPTLFATTGIAAFSLAFNVVSAWRTSGPALPSSPPNPEPQAGARPTLGNPWIAGVAAFILAVGVGNLDTIRVFANGVAKLGGYEIPQGLEWYFVEKYTDEYVEQFGVQPNEIGLLEVADRVSAALAADRFSDHVEYEIFKITSLVGGLFRGTLRLLNGEPLYIAPDRWFWAPTRVISEIPTVGGFAINEMPYFTFLYGDLHAHMIAMPLILFGAAFVFNEIMLAGRERRSHLTRWLALMLGAVAVGISKAVNTWDWPTLMLLSLAGLGYAWWLRWRSVNRRSLIDFLIWIGGFIALSLLAVLPYDYWFATAYNQVMSWQGGKTPIWAYLDIHGLFLFLLISLLVWETARWLRSVRVRALRGKASWLLGFLIAFMTVWFAGLLFFFRGERVTLVVLPLVAWIGVLFFRPGQSRVMQYVLVLAGLSLCITLGVEFVVLSGDIGRQNTVFKFYIQVWLFLSVAGGAAFAWLAAHSDRWRYGLRVAWYGFTGLLVFLAALYPIMATRGKSVFRMAPDMPLTLDGMDFMRYASFWEPGTAEPFSLIDDYHVIRWLQENVNGSPVIIEAQSEAEYRWGSRIANFTGLPSVVGWLHHQTQQRTFDPMPRLVRQRGANVNAFYTTLDIASAVNILRSYGVSYVIVSALERARYEASGGLVKFDQMVEEGLLAIVYREGNATIYEVDQAALQDIFTVSFSIEGE